MKSKNMKRILSIKIIREIDTDPDTSYYGEYSNHRTSEFSIDRAHSEDCASLFPLTSAAAKTLDRAAEYINSLRVDSELDTPEDEELSMAMAVINDLISEYENPDCDCYRNSRWSGREYRYFNPSFNYVTKHGKLVDGNTPEEVRKYVRQDYDRMESLNNQQWCYLGIRAEAEICIEYDIKSNVQREVNSLGPIQTIHSGGLYGIESDSDKNCLVGIEKEELAELRTELKALGFSSRAITTAFKNVQEEDR